MWRDSEADRAALIQATVRGDRVEPAPDGMQPRSRAEADFAAAVGPDEAGFTVREGSRLLAGAECGGVRRSRVTFEWR